MRRVFIILAICLLPAVPIVLVVTGILKSKPKTVAPVTLTVWGTAEDAGNLAGVIAKYRNSRPYINISYTQVRPEDYTQQLISAWAQGTGPDIFFVPSTTIGQMTDYAVAMPPNLTIPQVVASKGLFGTTSSVVTSAKPAPTTAALKNEFVGAVTDNVIRDGQVWGLPLSMDTIVEYYNKDLLNNAKIFEPAATWSDLQSQVSANHLTMINQKGEIVQSGVALGTTINLPYGVDLLALLMMQNGSLMTTADRQAHLNDADGLQALQFYLSFAQSEKSNYSWNEQQTNARDAFLQGKVGYYFGTLADRPTIVASALNWGVSPMLHVRSSGDNDGATGTERYIDAAEYQVPMVSKFSATSGRAVYAWNFIEYITQAANVTSYLQSSNQLSAQRAILAQVQNDPDLGVFAKQLLTAKTWYNGHDGTAVDGYMQQLITGGLAAKTDLTKLLDLANTQIQSTL